MKRGKKKGIELEKKIEIWIVKKNLGGNEIGMEIENEIKE